MTLLALTGWGIVGCLALVVAGLVTDGRRRAAQLARGCHELRGPLTAARLGLALSPDATPARTALRLRAVDAELRRAALIVEDLSGRTEWRGRPGEERGGAGTVDLERVAGDVLEARVAAAAAAGVEVELWPASAVVAGDERRIAQALGNLLDNAIGHAAGVVGLTIEARADVARVEVTDDGPGLGEPLEAIVRRSRHGRGRHGHGLGVAAQVARDHGGRLSTAPSACGARIVLELPRVSDEAAVGSP